MSFATFYLILIPTVFALFMGVLAYGRFVTQERPARKSREDSKRP